MHSTSRYLLVGLLACVFTLVGVPRVARAVPDAGAPALSGDADGGTRPRALPSPMQATNTCLSCHATLSDSKLRAPAKEYTASAHRDERIGCVGCHKGDPRDPTVGAHKTAGFDPHPRHSEVAGICGGCHSDAGYMRRINGRLPVGQAALFNLSLHGRLSAADDSDAPNCAACHGTHSILSPASPLSPVNRANVAKVCSGCHSVRARMAKYDANTDQFAKWEKSVHGKAFLSGNPNAPTCTGCHGAHSSMPPDAASVAHACGRCHEDEMNFFERSPHSQGFRKRGITQCVACHSNHDVAPASPALVGTNQEATCMKCHSHDEKPRKVADAISALLTGARERADAIRMNVTRVHDAGLRVAGIGFALDQLTSAELKTRGVVHTLDPAQVEASIVEIDRAITETRHLIESAEQVRARERRNYYIALAFAALLFVTLGLKAAQLHRRRRTGGP